MKKIILLLMFLIAAMAEAADTKLYLYTDTTNIYTFIGTNNAPNGRTNVVLTASGAGDVWTPSNNVMTGSNSMSSLWCGTYEGDPALDFAPVIIHTLGFTNNHWGGAGGGAWIGNSKLILAPTYGAGIDAYVGNGATWVLALAMTSAGHTFSQKVTAPSFVLSSPRWEDLRFPSTESPKKGVDDISVDEVNNGEIFATTATTNETDDHIYDTTQFPHCWQEESSIVPHVHFMQTNADQDSLWWLRYKWISVGATNVTGWTVVGPATNCAAYASGTMHQLANFAPISGSGKTVSSIFDWKLYRKGSVGTGNILLKEFDIHYLTDTPGGSANETTK